MGGHGLDGKQLLDVVEPAMRERFQLLKHEIKCNAYRLNHGVIAVCPVPLHIGTQKTRPPNLNT